MARRLNAWLTPDTATGATLSRCLTFPAELLPYVTGALSALTEPWRWEQFGTMSPSEAAYLSSAMLAQFLNECEGANVLLRQNTNEPCILERSDDNGVTWVQFADLSLCANPKPQTTTYPDYMRLNPVTGELEYSNDGGTTWYDYPTPVGTEPTQPWTPLRESQPGASDNERRCAAASSAAVSLAQMFSHTYGAIAAGLANTWGQFANFMNGLTDTIFGIQYGTVWDIVKIIGLWEPIDWETNYAAAELTSQQIDDLTCLIFEYTTIDGNGRAQADFGAIRDNVITTLGINPGTAVWTQLNYVQEAGLERMMDVGFGTVECGCGVCANYVDDLDGGPQSGTHPTPYNGITEAWGSSIVAGTWVDAAGRTGQGIWTSAAVNGGANNQAAIVIDLEEPCHVVQSRFWVRNSQGGFARTVRFTYYDAALSVLDDNSWLGTSSTTWSEVTDTVDLTNVRYIRLISETGGQANNRIDDITITMG